MFGDLVVNLVGRINQFTGPMSSARAVSARSAQQFANDQKRVAAAVKVSQQAQMDAMRQASAYADAKAAADAARIKRVNEMNAGRGGFNTHRGIMANQDADRTAAKRTQGIISRVRAAGGFVGSHPLQPVVAQSEGLLARLRNAFTAGRAAVASGVSGLMTSMSGLLRMGPIGVALAAAVAVLVPAVAAFGMIRWGTSQLLEAEKAQTAFTVMLGSGELAKSMLGDLKKYGRETGYGVATQKAAETMLAFGVSAQAVVPSIRAIGDIARGDAERMGSLALAFSQSSAAGRLMGQDLLQMVNAGFNPLQEISRRTGESLVELKKRMEDGKVPFAEVQAAFMSATSEGGKFHGMMDAIKGTMGGQLNILLANFGELIKEVTGGLLAGFDLEGALQNLNHWLDQARGGLSEWMPMLFAIGSIGRWVFEGIAGAIHVIFGIMTAFRDLVYSIVGVFVSLDKVKPTALASFNKDLKSTRDLMKEIQTSQSAAPQLPQKPKTPETAAEGVKDELVMRDGQAMTRGEESRRFNRDNPAPNESDMKKNVDRMKRSLGDPSPDLFVNETNSTADSVNAAIERKKGTVEAEKVNEKHAEDVRAAEKAKRDKMAGEMKPTKLDGALGVRSNEAYKAIVGAMANGRSNPQEKQQATLGKIAKSNEDMLREQRRAQDWNEQHQDTVVDTI